MAVYSITYDLIKDKDYTRIIDAIKSISGNWATPTKSQWLVETTKNESEIRNYLSSYIDNDDKIFVCKIEMPSWATRNISQSVLQWLHDRKNSN
ncbi:hypothetical protein [Acinetobacter soli]|uniref:hypothetical protein n=1 Tax=Acinetobacter soli TaxID=487316 RepID=UPI00125D8A67|nr:hypothetical protein [Acinetobacter soli]